MYVIRESSEIEEEKKKKKKQKKENTLFVAEVKSLTYRIFFPVRSHTFGIELRALTIALIGCLPCKYQPVKRNNGANFCSERIHSRIELNLGRSFLWCAIRTFTRSRMKQIPNQTATKKTTNQWQNLAKKIITTLEICRRCWLHDFVCIVKPVPSNSTENQWWKKRTCSSLGKKATTTTTAPTNITTSWVRHLNSQVWRKLVARKKTRKKTIFWAHSWNPFENSYFASFHARLLSK